MYKPLFKRTALPAVLLALLSACAGPAVVTVRTTDPGPWVAGVDCRLGLSTSDAPRRVPGSDAWRAAVGRRLGILDGQGHGPDPGSAEWRRAVDFKLFGDGTSDTVDMSYVSAAGQRLHAVYDLAALTVRVTHAGHTQTLAQAISASGARYTAGDGQVFWNKGRQATLWRHDARIFTGHELTGCADPDGILTE